MFTERMARYVSPFGFQLDYPVNWNPQPHGDTVSFLAPSDPLCRLAVMTSQVQESEQESLEANLITALRRRQSIEHIEHIHTPRQAGLIETECDDGSRRTYITELLDNGKLARTYMMSLPRAHSQTSAEQLLWIWRRVIPEDRKAAPDYRRIGLEARGFVFEFPRDWIVGHIDNETILLRSPARRAAQPNIVVTCGTNTPSSSLSSLRDLAAARNEPQAPGKWLGERATSLGNIQGLELELEMVNLDGLLDHGKIWIAEPVARGWCIILVRGVASRWLDYCPLFEHVRNSLYWVRQPIQ